MISGHPGQAGLLAQRRVVTELDVELDAVTTRFHATATAVDGASAQAPIPGRAFYEAVQVT